MGIYSILCCYFLPGPASLTCWWGWCCQVGGYQTPRCGLVGHRLFFLGSWEVQKKRQWDEVYLRLIRWVIFKVNNIHHTMCTFTTVFLFILQLSPPTCRWQRVSRDRSLSRLLALSFVGLLGWRSFSDVLLPRLPANFGSCLKRKATEEERWRTGVIKVDVMMWSPTSRSINSWYVFFHCKDSYLL